jgi:hypothetical protein
VKAKPEVEKKLEDIPIVCDYPYVFAEILLGQPPDREIEFTIDIPGTQPIHKAPHRMAQSKLKKLKEQLQELLDRVFIHTVSILASFCVWTKSLMCKRCCKQGFHLSEYFQKTLHCEKDKRFQIPCQPSG